MATLSIPCPACKQNGDHEEMYLGCQRPCPHCGQMVAVADADADVKETLTWVEVCGCGCKRREMEEGTEFELRYASKPSGQPNWLLNLFLLPLGLMIMPRQDPPSFVLGWACEACAGRIRWLKRALLLPFVGAPLIWLALMVPTYFMLQQSNPRGLQPALFSWGMLHAAVAVVGSFLISLVLRAILSEPLYKRFGKGLIDKVRITN